LATVTEPAPVRLLWHVPTVVDWLYTQLHGVIMDATEAQAISGNGLGTNQTGVLYQSGVAVQHQVTDTPTTIRSAITKLQNLGERVTGIALNPTDAQNIDLLRWTSANGGFLTGGFENDNGSFGGTSANLLGTGAVRIVSRNVPAGVALLGDWDQLVLSYRDSMRIDLATTRRGGCGCTRETQRPVHGELRRPSVGDLIEDAPAGAYGFLLHRSGDQR
jgi:hypothetical protein